MNKISIICCYNNREKLNYLTDSLAVQDVEYEPVMVDNSDNRFKCAAAALNYGAAQAHGDLLFFVHQDICFKTKDSLRKLAENAEKTSKYDISGCAGAILENGRKKTITNMTYSASEKHYPNVFNRDYVEVESLDECLFIMWKDAWKEHHFDEIVCDHWHFYAVEQCLYFRLKGGKVRVFDAQINHLSETGTLDRTYFRALLRLLKRYRKDYPYIVSTTGYWRTKGYYRVIRHIARQIRLKLKGGKKV